MPATNVEKLLRSLHDHGVEFVIIGGAAAVLQGSAYVTADLDLCYSRKRANLQRLAQALETFHPLLRAVSERVPFSLDVSALASGMNFTLTTDAGALDIRVRLRESVITRRLRSSRKKWEYSTCPVEF